MNEFDGVTGTRLAPVSAVLPAVLATLVLSACLHPTALGEWLNGLPVHPLVEAAISTAAQWQDGLAELGLSQYFEQIRAGMQSLREVMWD